MKVWYWHWAIILLYAVQFTRSHLTILIAQNNGNDTECLKNNFSTPCQTLKYVLQHVLVSNETFVDINFVEDYRFLIDHPLYIHTGKNRSLRLRMFSKLSAYDIELTCSGHALRMFDLYGQKLILEFHNITFDNCCQSHHPNFEDVMPVISVNNTRKVAFYSCIFQNNLCGAFFAVNSDIYIEYSRFQNNSISKIFNQRTFQTKDMSTFSGGVGVLFQNEQREMSINISHSRFIDNHVHCDYSKYYAAQNQPNAVKNGGAIHVTFRNKSKSLTKIVITSCYFKGNKATFGGALLIELFGKTLHNKIFISSSQFVDNKGSQAGGGFVLSIWDLSAKTELTMVGTNFTENWSKNGGALYVFIHSNYSSRQVIKEIFLFKQVQFISNLGPSASSVTIASHLFGPLSTNQLTVFEDCLFINNTSPGLNGYAYMGSFVVDRVNIRFQGRNTFAGNSIFGAIYFSNSYISVQGNLHFLENIGLRGAGISLQNSQIVVYPGADLLFQNNHAAFGGGAIYVATNIVYHVGVIRNQFCFLVYSERDKLNPNEWNVSINIEYDT